MHSPTSPSCNVLFACHCVCWTVEEENPTLWFEEQFASALGMFIDQKQLSPPAQNISAVAHQSPPVNVLLNGVAGLQVTT